MIYIWPSGTEDSSNELEEMAGTQISYVLTGAKIPVSTGFLHLFVIRAIYKMQYCVICLLI